MKAVGTYSLSSWEFEAACGGGAAQRRRQPLATHLEAAGHNPDRVQHAAGHAYQMGLLPVILVWSLML